MLYTMRNGQQIGDRLTVQLDAHPQHEVQDLLTVLDDAMWIACLGCNVNCCQHEPEPQQQSGQSQASTKTHATIGWLQSNGIGAYVSP